MRKFFIAFALALATGNIVAQNAFQYQALVQNTDGSAAKNEEISIRFRITDADENTVFEETHRTTTDSNGHLSLPIGNGNAEIGEFRLIDWSNGGMMLHTEMTRGNGTTISGTQEFSAVPYAISAAACGGLTGISADGTFWRMTVDNEGNLGTEKVISEIIPIPDGYSKLVFNDEFNGEGLPDSSKWGYEVGYIRGNELQYYTNARLENCYLQDGVLNIVARNDNFEADGTVHEITSASVHTKDKGKWKYCRVDVRAKLPSSRGTWPAIWMMPNNDVYGYWPNSGEIDIMENVGFDPNKIHFTAHCRDINGGNTKYHSSYNVPTCFSEFHVYSLIWTEDKLTWLVDNKQRFSIKNTAASWTSWPFCQDFYLILNLAYGGDWGGQQGVDLSQLPQTYQIDYVRVYQ